MAGCMTVTEYLAPGRLHGLGSTRACGELLDAVESFYLFTIQTEAAPVLLLLLLSINSSLHTRGEMFLN